MMKNTASDGKITGVTPGLRIRQCLVKIRIICRPLILYAHSCVLSISG